MERLQVHLAWRFPEVDGVGGGWISPVVRESAVSDMSGITEMMDRVGNVPFDQVWQDPYQPDGRRAGKGLICVISLYYPAFCWW